MVVRVSTVAFEGVEARPIDVQVQIASGNVAFMIVGLGDKAVAELRERVRAALIASGLALPARRITVNLAPADMPKEGSHYDLPIALGVMAAIGAIPARRAAGLYGDRRTGARRGGHRGRRRSAGGDRRQCARARPDLPGRCGPEAAWASADLDILAPRSLIQLANHFKGTQVLARPGPAMRGGGRATARPARHQGPGKRQARARSRGGGRP